MRTLSLDFAAGETKSFAMPGFFFRILGSAVSSVDVEFFRNNSTTGEKAYAVDAGYFASPEGGFTRFDITSNGIQTVKIAVSNGAGGYDRTVGSVDVTNTPNVVVTNTPNVVVTNIPGVNSTWYHAMPVVTTSSVVLTNANPNRRVLVIQNKDAVGSIWIRLDGGVASASVGFKLKPGEIFSAIGFAPTGDVTAIGDIASNPNVAMVEG